MLLDSRRLWSFLCRGWLMGDRGAAKGLTNTFPVPSHGLLRLSLHMCILSFWAVCHLLICSQLRALLNFIHALGLGYEVDKRPLDIWVEVVDDVLFLGHREGRQQTVLQLPAPRLWVYLLRFA